MTRGKCPTQLTPQQRHRQLVALLAMAVTRMPAAIGGRPGTPGEKLSQTGRSCLDDPAGMPLSGRTVDAVRMPRREAS